MVSLRVTRLTKSQLNNQKKPKEETTTKRFSKDIIEQQMNYQIKGGFYEEIHKSKVFFEIGIDSKTLEKNDKSEERMNREKQQP